MSRRIGVTQRCADDEATGERRYALDARWFEFLSACGVLAVPLPNIAEVALRTADELSLDGFLFTGGGDLAEAGGNQPERDETERELLALAIREGRPVLGVCRGMELIATALGARLKPVDGHVATRHTITQEDGERVVNSYHDLAVDGLPAEVVVTAWCEDVVEAVRHRDAPVEGIMWHPEREPVHAQPDLLLVRRLFRAVDR
ncbi:gamma-glutamyl-gamma-aminobutyrate hydrolase family protein [Umezawaea endophytica]|uniref:Gamma-glutamyl-gamma-aminobutyrate hydrolase family protein n=1 Tax=Umezawaea endophytica TaxID=1654476 RepID=A0A9X2VJ34_9PSEU|nr:gamma-glutamyl-gamma-aminobutyrate hydrolase family protein [Umezawaea endophytica]MCS7477022.1 gamma-glutamyl-gamma-aminobutyrate hydrolase family protein [Umezawaea endophytica]